VSSWLPPRIPEPWHTRHVVNGQGRRYLRTAVAARQVQWVMPAPSDSSRNWCINGHAWVEPQGSAVEAWRKTGTKVGRAISNVWVSGWTRSEQEHLGRYSRNLDVYRVRTYHDHCHIRATRPINDAASSRHVSLQCFATT